MSSDGARKRGCLVLLGAAVALLWGLPPAAASAALPDEDPWGGKRCTTGAGAGQCQIPRGIAASPDNGRVFVADQFNQRIVELNALGEFVKAWGWGVDTGAPEFEICTEASGCQEGLEGAGNGQLAAPLGVALDSGSNVYVVDFLNNRVQKFDREGNFLLMFGGEVNKTKVESGIASEAEENLCPVDPGDECQQGVQGAGNGQFGAWAISDFIAIDDRGTSTDADDRVYVGDEGRIQQFDAIGSYQDQCSVPGTVQSLDVDAAGNLYLKYSGELKIRKLTAPPACELLAAPAFEFKADDGATVPSTAVAVDPAGNVYAFGPTNPGNPTDPIVKFDPTGKELERFGKGEFTASTGMAANLCPESEAPGNLYVSNSQFGNSFIRAYGTAPIGCFKARTLPPSEVEETSATLRGTVNPSGLVVSECFFEYGTTTEYGQIAPCEPSAGELGSGSVPVPVSAEVSGLAAAAVHHVRLVATVGGEVEPGADVEFKTKGPPAISEDHVVFVTDTEARLQALVNPEGLPTTYSFQYTTQADFEAKGFEGAQSTPPTPIGEDRENHTATATLKGLTPGTSYRWRVVASNTAALAGGTSEGPARSLRTYLPAVIDTGCPNQAFRTEASAFLPDCRAYEMVSPVDKNGGDIVRGSITAGDPDSYTQARPDGGKITYTSLSGFGERESGVNFNQYLAERGAGGWSGRGIDPPITGEGIRPGTFNTDRKYMGFTDDLCLGWLVDEQTPPLAGGIDGYTNLHRRENCEPGEGELEALTDVEPTPGTSPHYITKNLSFQGASADGSHALFVAQAKLTAEAPEDDSFKLYDDRFGGAIHLVSIRPDKSPGDPTFGDGMGVPSGGELGAANGWQGNLEGAVSQDGSRAYWSGGGLFLRIHPEQGLVADECSEPSKACTIKVGGFEPQFWEAAADGSKALYTEGGQLFEFDLGRREAGEKASLAIAKEVLGVAGAARDLSRTYFVSREALAGAGANSEGEEAVEGAPNLYLYEAADQSFGFAATLSEKDVGEKEPGAAFPPYNVVAANPYQRPSRVSADGSAIALNSRASLTGYDNTDTDSGKAAVEVFIYRAAGGRLECASCSPGGARPQVVADVKQPYTFPWDPGNFATLTPAAAQLPTWEQPTHASRPLSDDGRRLFFNAYDALLPRDTNGEMDVYEWEAAGTGGCEAADPNFFPDNGGCVYLISSGDSSHESEFWEASADGSDVFFTTEASLVAPDSGSIDLYDARVGGGFDYPEPKSDCQGEACQSPPPAPQFSSPSSSLYNGPPNPGPDCRGLARRAARLARQSRRTRKAARRAAAPRRARQLRRRAARFGERAKRASRTAKRCRRAGR